MQTKTKKTDKTEARTPNQARILISKMPISLPNPIVDQLLELSYRDSSYKWSFIEFGEEITQEESIIANFYTPYLGAGACRTHVYMTRLGIN